VRSFLLALVLLLQASPLPASFAPPSGALDKPWNQWRYSRPLELDPNQTGALARVTVPMEVFTRARPRLDDLRLVDVKVAPEGVHYLCTGREPSVTNSFAEPENVSVQRQELKGLSERCRVTLPRHSASVLELSMS